MAFVLIQHLAPQHASQLSALLARTTAMPVHRGGRGAQLQPNCVFVIPPNKLMSISGGALELAPRTERNSHVPCRSITSFARWLETREAKAVGVVLSGTNSDGALGLQAIREMGGLAIAQSEDSAKFAGMPHNAAGAGFVDLILPPEAIARELGRIGQQGLLIGSSEEPARVKPTGPTLAGEPGRTSGA